MITADSYWLFGVSFSTILALFSLAGAMLAPVSFRLKSREEKLKNKRHESQVEMCVLCPIQFSITEI